MIGANQHIRAGLVLLKGLRYIHIVRRQRTFEEIDRRCRREQRPSWDAAMYEEP